MYVRLNPAAAAGIGGGGSDMFWGRSLPAVALVPALSSNWPASGHGAMDEQSTLFDDWSGRRCKVARTSATSAPRAPRLPPRNASMYNDVDTQVSSGWSGLMDQCCDMRSTRFFLFSH